LESDNPIVMLWPLLSTWTRSAVVLPDSELATWQAACNTLGLSDKRFAERVEGLDHFLDELDILLEEFAQANGLDTETGF